MTKKVTKAKPIITLEGKTKAEKKCIIAQDIIANINARVYIANKGSYISSVISTDSSRGDDIRQGSMAKDGVKENFDKIKSCNVCALGACLMSITKFNTRLNFEDLPSGIRWGTKELGLLTEIFTASELAKIEVAFEGQWDDDESNIGRDKLDANLSDKTVEKIMCFRKLYNSSEERLVGIMESIIKNNGKVQF